LSSSLDRTGRISNWHSNRNLKIKYVNICDYPQDSPY
jgi:hypothetical protein